MNNILVLDGNASSAQYIPEGVNAIFLQGTRRAGLIDSIPCDRVFIYKDETEALKIAAKLQDEYGFLSIVCFYEYSLLLAAEISENCRIYGNSIYSVVHTRNKLKMRELLTREGIDETPYSKLATVTNEFLSSAKFPLILKPIEGAGSLGVKVVRDVIELEKLTSSFSHREQEDYMVEKLVRGNEFSVESIVKDGRVCFSTVTQKYKYLNETVEIAHIQPAPISSELELLLKNKAEAVINALKINFGAVHTEIIINESGSCTIVESHTRYGGDRIWEMTRDLFSISPQEATYLTSIKKEPVFKNSNWKTAGVYFHHGEGRILGINTDCLISSAERVRHRIDFDSEKYWNAPTSSEERIGYSYALSEGTIDPLLMMSEFKEIVLLG